MAKPPFLDIRFQLLDEQRQQIVPDRFFLFFDPAHQLLASPGQARLDGAFRKVKQLGKLTVT
jgi:hypothetical protein